MRGGCVAQFSRLRSDTLDNAQCAVTSLTMFLNTLVTDWKEMWAGGVRERSERAKGDLDNP